MCTRYTRLGEAVLTSTHNLCFFFSRNKKNNVYPCKPQFYYIKVGFKGVKTIWACFRDGYYCMMPVQQVVSGIYWCANNLPNSLQTTIDFSLIYICKCSEPHSCCLFLCFFVVVFFFFFFFFFVFFFFFFFSVQM